MKIKFFDKGLYLEGLRQLRKFGIFLSVILCIVATVIPLGEGIISLRRSTNYVHAQTVDGILMNPSLFAVFVILAPIMVLMLFGFLNKRRTSDFYHSIPHTRLAIFFSFYAALMSWVAIMILSSSACAMIAYACFPTVFLPQYLGLLLFMLTAFVASLLTVGATLIAVSASGTLFINALLTGLILYLPRITISSLNGSLQDAVPILSQSHNLPLIDTGYNLLISMFTTLFSGGLTVENYVTLHGVIYTAVVGLIYTALAALLFVRRKSESAERSAPSRRLQTTYRTLVTMCICLFACTMIFSMICDKRTSDGEIFGIIVLYIISLIIYLGYELITTRKWKNLLRAIPGLGIVLGLNVVILASLFGLRAYHLSFNPTENEIKSVSVAADYDYYRSNTEILFYDYAHSRIEDIRLDTPESKRIVATVLSESIDTLKTRGADEYRQSFYISTNHHEYTHKEEVTFRIETSSGVAYRTLYLTQEQNNLIHNQLAQSSKYRDIHMEIPAPNALYGGYRSLSISASGLLYYNNIPEKTAKEILTTLSDEVAALGFDRWFEALQNENYNCASISYPLSSSTRLNISVNPDILPKTATLLLRTMASLDNDTNDGNIVETIGQSIERFDSLYYLSADLHVDLTDPETGRISRYTLSCQRDGSSLETAYPGQETDSPGYISKIGKAEYAKIMNYLTSKVSEGDYQPGDGFLLIYLWFESDSTVDSKNEPLYGDSQGILILSDVTEDDLLSLGFYPADGSVEVPDTMIID